MRSLRGAVLLVLASTAYSQTPAAKPAGLEFEVASIKPAAPPNPASFQAGKIHVGMNIDAARVDIGFMSLSDLMTLAFKVKQYQISGPDWMAAQRFDVLAKMPEGATKDDVPQMLQALLAERFKLTFHRESKENSVYALVVGKNGPKLKESPPDETDPPAADGKSGTTINTGNGPVRITQSGDGTNASAVIRTKEAGTTKMSMGPNGTMHLESSKVTLSQFADMLSRFMDRPVVDMTDLKGTYQVAVDLSMEDLRGMARKAGVVIPAGAGPGGGEAAGRSAADSASEPSGASIFAAVQQLGLKLEARKAPIDIIVVDHLEKTPTEN